MNKIAHSIGNGVTIARGDYNCVIRQGGMSGPFLGFLKRMFVRTQSAGDFLDDFFKNITIKQHSLIKGENKSPNPPEDGHACHLLISCRQNSRSLDLL